MKNLARRQLITFPNSYFHHICIQLNPVAQEDFPCGSELLHDLKILCWKRINCHERQIYRFELWEMRGTYLKEKQRPLSSRSGATV